MTIREEIENDELQRLSPYATFSSKTEGRDVPIEPCEIRTEFQRDRDKIIHCKSFRRLKFKTQVFLSPKGDHYRTRLTHTLEVAQVARTLARALKLNEDLVEAIALGHDLGHTPFGHIGERTLNAINPDGFEHNAQSLRIVETLENGNGLNLTKEVRNGIRWHSGPTQPSSLEAMCVRRADRIAYINHDIDDALRAGIIKKFELPKHCLDVLGHTHSDRIDSMIKNIIYKSKGKPIVEMSSEFQEASNELRDFMFRNVYKAKWRAFEEKKCDFVIRTLYDYFLNNPAKMPLEFVEVSFREGINRAVTDYIACMSDRFAINMFKQLFVPNEFSFESLESDMDVIMHFD